MKTLTRAAIFTTAITLLAAVGGSPAGAASGFDTAMQPVLGEYLKIHKALAGDSEKGVTAAAGKIGKLAAKLDPKPASGPHAAHLKALPKAIKAAADKLARAKTLAEMREAFKELSRPMAMWASISQPKGVKVMSCSMAKASWLQQGKAIRNPYYGSKMLGCGEVVGGVNDGKMGNGGHGRMKHSGAM